MKALSLKQPWASWVVAGAKKIETRTWPTKHRGPLMICSSLRVDAKAMVTACQDNRGYTADAFPLGVALGIVSVLDCRPMTKDDETAALFPCSPGRWAWVLAPEIYRFTPPVRTKGALGIFEVPWAHTPAGLPLP